MNNKGKRQAIIDLRTHKKRPEREGDFWSSDERENLSQFFMDGFDISEIALQLERSETAIIQQIEKLDLYNRTLVPKRKKRSKDDSCHCGTCTADKKDCPRCQADKEGENV